MVLLFLHSSFSQLNTKVYPYKFNQGLMFLLGANNSTLLSATRSMIYSYDIQTSKVDSASPAEGWTLVRFKDITTLPTGEFLVLQKDMGSVIEWAVNFWQPGEEPIEDTLAGFPNNKIPLGVECCKNEQPLVIAHNGLSLFDGQSWKWIDGPWVNAEDFSVNDSLLWVVNELGVWRLALLDSIKESVLPFVEGGSVTPVISRDIWADTLFILDDDLGIPNSTSLRKIIATTSGAWVGLEGKVAFISSADSLVKSWALPEFSLVTDIDPIQPDTLLIACDNGVYKAYVHIGQDSTDWLLSFRGIEEGSYGIKAIDSSNGEWYGAGIEGFMKRTPLGWVSLFKPSGLDVYLHNSHFHKNNELWLKGYRLADKPYKVHPSILNWMIPMNDSQFWFYENGHWMFQNYSSEVIDLGYAPLAVEVASTGKEELLAWGGDSLTTISPTKIETQFFPKGTIGGVASISSEIFVFSSDTLWKEELDGFSIVQTNVLNLQGYDNEVYFCTEDSLFMIDRNFQKSSIPTPEKLRVSGVLKSGDSLWVSIVFGGLWLYSNQTWEHFTTRNGLGDNGIRDIESDVNGNIWLLGDLNLTKIILNPHEETNTGTLTNSINFNKFREYYNTMYLNKYREYYNAKGQSEGIKRETDLLNSNRSILYHKQ